jgi:SAM-dependent methyltransferase
VSGALDSARERARMPEGTSAILDTRSLASSHRRLAEMLRPGMSVLDVGCGTGAITRGIAERVGPEGRAVGVDAKESFIETAKSRHAGVANLAFEIGDVYQLSYRDVFDVVAAARVLQWLADPVAALRSIACAVKIGGRLVILDYNHEKIAWTPEPPESMKHFYQAFLRWRADAGMDNAIADHLASLFTTMGLRDVAASPQHETVRRGDAGFETGVGIWAEVAASRGHQMVTDGVISEPERATAESEYREWMVSSAESQTMYLLAVEGIRER